MKENGVSNDKQTVLAANQMFYTHTNSVNQEDKDPPEKGFASLPLSYYGIDVYNDLLEAITNGTSYDTGAIPYAPYGGEQVGYLRVIASKDVNAQAIEDDAPETHLTKE